MCEAHYKVPRVPGFGMRPSWSVLTRLTDSRACKETGRVRISLLNPRIRITFFCNFLKLTKRHVRKQRTEPWQHSPEELRGECRNKHGQSFKPVYLLKVEYTRSWMWVSDRQEECQGLSRRQSWCLAPVWKSLSCISNLWLLHPIPPPKIYPPSRLGYGVSLKFLFVPPPEQTLNSDWHATLSVCRLGRPGPASGFLSQLLLHHFVERKKNQ